MGGGFYSLMCLFAPITQSIGAVLKKVSDGRVLQVLFADTVKEAVIHNKLRCFFFGVHATVCI